MSDDDQSIPVKRGGLGSINVYDVTADELEALEQGEANAALKDIGIMLTSIGVGLVPVVLTFEKPEQDLTKFVSFALCCGLGLLVGMVCLALWWYGRRGKLTVIQRIRRRLVVTELRVVSQGRTTQLEPLPSSIGSESEGEGAPKS